MSRILVRRRGLGVLVSLVAVSGFLVVEAQNAYAVAALALVAPVLAAELSGHSDRLARLLLVGATALLPQVARARWRQDLLASLADPEDGRGSLDFAIDAALGMPRIVWREWVAAFPAVTLFDDELSLSVSTAVRVALASVALLLLPALSYGQWGGWQVGEIAMPLMLAWCVSDPRPESGTQRMRVVLSFAPILIVYAALDVPDVRVLGGVAVFASIAVATTARRARVPWLLAVAVTLLPGLVACWSTSPMGPGRVMAPVVTYAALGFACGIGLTVAIGQVSAAVKEVVFALCIGLGMGICLEVLGLRIGETLWAVVAFSTGEWAVSLAFRTQLCRRLVPLGAHALGHARYASGDRIGASVAWRRAVDVDPSPSEWADAAYNAGVALEQAGKLDEACTMYGIAEGRDGPGDRPTVAAFRRGYLCEQLGDADGALAAYQIVIDSRHPECAAWAANNSGAILFERGDVDGARAKLRIAISHGDAVAEHNLVALPDAKP